MKRKVWIDASDWLSDYSEKQLRAWYQDKERYKKKQKKLTEIQDKKMKKKMRKKYGKKKKASESN
ncbi:hypothetical protein [Paeniclostridium hominis]|uniref:hypothetical protein n=1 Tax=Paeniclostridium hominis TaxID=2764329 RepID=UPI0022E3D783|nr:hypothetical protein [Paeniclostridium hominis]